MENDFNNVPLEASRETAGFHCSLEELIPVESFDWDAVEIPFNHCWKFFQGDVTGGEGAGLDDSAWNLVSLPHDYSISQPYSPQMEAESGYLPGGTGWYRKYFFLPRHLENRRIRLDFDGVYMNASVWINGKKLGFHPYGYTPFSFDLTPWLLFGGENLLAVRVDHRIPSSRWYSGSGIYRGVSLTVTGGIHAGLHGITVLTPKLSEEAGGLITVQIKTVIENHSKKSACVCLNHTIYRKEDLGGTPIGGTATETPFFMEPGETRLETCEFVTVSSPQLWAPEHPAVYVVQTQITADGTESDCRLTDFGFRFFHFDCDGGFFLNGQPLKLKGVCLHHDHGALGAAACPRAMERQLELLADMGCNSIRVTHNPAARDFIDLCSRKGFLVIEEFFDGWHGSKNGNSEDYGRWYGRQIGTDNALLNADASMTWEEFDLKAAIGRDINAPCVIMWSLGNEVMEGIGIDPGEYPRQAAKLISWTREADLSRPVTTGENRLKLNQPEAVCISELLDQAGGAVGFNYTDLSMLDKFHKRHPSWCIYGSETASSINSRGVYDPGQYDRQYTSFDESKVAWGHYASQSWYDTIRKDYVAGTYVWTGFDYIGEPTNYNGIGPGAASLPWPAPKHSYFGILDTAGFPKDSYYLYQSLWNDRVCTVHILPVWNEELIVKEPDGRVKVVVYSNARSVELLFTPARTGIPVSLGRKTFTVKTSEGGRYSYQYYEGEEAGSGEDQKLEVDRGPEEYRNLYLTWKVPYEDGTLTAAGYDRNGRMITQTVGRSSVTTAKKACRLRLTADRTCIRADGADLCYITADITDDQGTPVPDASSRVTFQIQGEGTIAGVDNGLSVDHEPYQSDSRRAFGGKVLAIVRAAAREGAFTLSASSDGLEGASVTVAVRRHKAEGATDSTHDTDAGSGCPSDSVSVCAYYRLVRNYYAVPGCLPEFPRELTVTGIDGFQRKIPVVWAPINPDTIRQPGIYSINGTAGDFTVSVNLSVCPPVTSVPDYHTTILKGTKPELPMYLYGTGEDGRIVPAALFIHWKMPGPDAYEKEGTMEVSGQTEAFGRRFSVKAWIRVEARRYRLAADVASKARQSFLVSGDAASAVLLFSYDTQELLGRAVLNLALGHYVGEDHAERRHSSPPVTGKWYLSNVSPDGPWLPLETKEIRETPEAPAKSQNAPDLTRYIYDFTPVMATYLRLELHVPCHTWKTEDKKKPEFIAITKTELFRAEAIPQDSDSTGK